MEVINRPNCLICKYPGTFDSNIESDFSGKSFNYLRCDKCGMGWIANPNIDFESIYGEEYYKGQGADIFLTYWDEMYPANNEFNRNLRDVEYAGIFKTFIHTSGKSNKLFAHLDFGGGWEGSFGIFSITK